MSTNSKQTSATIEAELGAAFIASGIGSTVLGVMTTLAEASEPIRSNLFWFGRGGPLGGETSLAIIVFILSWAGLAIVFKEHPARLSTAFALALALVSIGLLLTFPPIFKWLAQLFGA